MISRQESGDLLLNSQTSPLTYNRREVDTKPQDIFHYYSVENTVDFLRTKEKRGLTEPMASAYLWIEVVRTMGEFAFEEKIAKIVYFLKDGRLYPENLVEPAAEIYQRSNFGKREEAEIFGFLEIEKIFAQNQANLAFWLSPPSPNRPDHGNYGFLFVFVAQGNGLVEEYIFRYPEDKKTLAQTLKIYQEIFPKTFSSQNFIEGKNELFYLSDPRFLNASQPKELLTQIIGQLKQKGIKVADPSLSLETETILANDKIFQELFSCYRELVKFLIDNPSLSLPEYYQVLAQAKSYFSQLYNRAVDLAYLTSQKKNRQLFQTGNGEGIYPFTLPPPLGFGNLNRAPLVFGGGSCPASPSKSISSLADPLKTLTDLVSQVGIINHSQASELVSDENYSFDHEGECVICGQKKLLGPCEICNECDEKLKNQNH